MPDWTRHPVVPDNVALEKPLLYGPHGEILIKQVPRAVGFRAPATQEGPPNFGLQELSRGVLPSDLQKAIDAVLKPSA
jgi:hypothetical protein